MQKVFENCYMLDKKCYEQYGLSEDILMEHAAAGMANYIRTHFSQGASVLIAAGMGNNGADGIALARQLHGDYDNRLHIPFQLRSAIAKEQFERAAYLGVKVVETISKAYDVVDAIL